VYGACEQEPFKLMQRCLAATDARTCTEHSECAWDPDGSECFAAQHAMVSSLLGDNTRAATAAKVCHAFPNAIACKAAGSVEFEQRTVEALLPDAKAVKLALAAEGDDKSGYQPFSLED
jgi:hypothetical protein